MREAWYDTAQICLNGHIITTITKTSPELQKKFCDRCGAATITKCPECEVDIPGHLVRPGAVTIPRIFEMPKFCSNCGFAYPWTESRLKAAHDLANEITEISEEERNVLNQSLDELVKDTPQTEVATVRFKKIVSKAGPELYDAFKKILIEVVSETAKKLIWGG